MPHRPLHKLEGEAALEGPEGCTSDPRVPHVKEPAFVGRGLAQSARGIELKVARSLQMGQQAGVGRLA